jgi:hypothetical protein
MLNPITWYISGFHGQSEAVWVFLMILAWYLVQVKKSALLAAMSVAIAIAYKLPAVILFPVVLLTEQNRRRQLVMIFIVGALVLASLFPEVMTTRDAVMRQVFAYNSTPGIWGITSLLYKVYWPKEADLLLPSVTKYLKIILFGFVALELLRYWGNKNRDFFVTSLMIITIFLVFTPGFGVQYLLWPLPFLILVKHRWVKWYTLFVTIGCLHTYGTSFYILTAPIVYLQNVLYNKTHILYPYDIFFPVWILLVRIFRQRVPQPQIAAEEVKVKKKNK